MPRSHRLADHRPGLAAGRGVEPGGRLVEEQELGVADEAEGHVESALLATREGLDPGAGLLGEPDQPDDLVDLARGAVVAGVHPQHLGHREVGVDGGLLEHDADPFAQVEAAVSWVGAQDRHRAGVARPVALEDLHERGLAGAVGSEHGQHLALVDMEVDALQGLEAAVGLPQPTHLDGDHAPRSARSRRRPRQCRGCRWTRAVTEGSCGAAAAFRTPVVWRRSRSARQTMRAAQEYLVTKPRRRNVASMRARNTAEMTSRTRPPKPARARSPQGMARPSSRVRMASKA